MERQEISEKMTRARIVLINAHPFFGTLALRLDVQATGAVPTMGVDGRNLYYNPKWADALPFEQLVGVMAHEVMHCALAHHTRFGKRDPRTWNEACDHAINPLLTEAGFELPADGLSTRGKPKYAGKAAEEIYAALWEAKQKAPREPQGGGGSGQGGGKGRSKGGGQAGAPGGQEGKGGGAKGDAPERARPKAKGNKADDDEGGGEEEDDENDEGAGEGDGQEEDGGEDMGGGEGGEGEGEQPQPEADDVGGCGSFSAPREEDGKPASASTLEEQAREWQVATAQAAAVAKKAGNMPGSMATLLDKLRAPEVDWREQLRRFVDSAAKQNYSWCPPNRRHIASGLYLPALTNDGLGEIVFAIDTSGSMHDDALQRAVDELNSILNDLQPETVHIIQCDTRVNEVQEVHAGDYPIKVVAKGRGGTLFTPVFKKVEELGIRPVCMIFFSDLEGYDFPEEPEYPVLWTSPPGSYGNAPWGETIKILA